jgi:DNA-binding NarL/FixJ family response regulator
VTLRRRCAAACHRASGLPLSPGPGAAPLRVGPSPRRIEGVPSTVLIVDDHAGFRASARTLLELEGFDVVGEAADAAAALALACMLEPDLVLLDVVLPDGSGFDVAERLAGGPSAVILVSSRAGADYGSRVRASGALGFVPKDRLTGEALRGLLAGAA